MMNGVQHEELFNVIPNMSTPDDPYPDYLTGINKYNPKGHPTNCSYVTLARLLNQDYLWLEKKGLLEGRADPNDNMVANLHVTRDVAAEAVKILNKDLESVHDDIKKGRSATLWFPDEQMRGTYAEQKGQNPLELCRGLAMVWDVDRMGVMYLPPGAQKTGHCIVYERSWAKQEGMFWDYQSDRWVDPVTVKPLGCYAIAFKKPHVV